MKYVSNILRWRTNLVHGLRRLKREDGLAMVVAIGAMTVISLLLAAVASSSVSLSTTSERDRHSKRALAATEAGLREAIYRLNNLAPGDAACVGSWDAAMNACKTEGKTLGNGTTYSYYMTTVPFTGTCAGIGASADANLAVRCITVEANANGSTRRVQARVSRYLGAPLLPLAGMFGKDGVSLSNRSTINGVLGSNGVIETSNTQYVRDGIKLGPSGSLDSSGTVSGGVTPLVVNRTAAEGDYGIAPLDFGNSATVNDNGAWSPTGATYDASTRSLNLTGGNFTFNGGTYNLCKLTTGSAATIIVPAGKKVLLLIDSPDRPGSGCPTGTGFLRAANNVTVNNPNAADAFQIHAWGSDPDGGYVIHFTNQLVMTGVMTAWQGTVRLSNTTTFTGGIAAAYLNITGQMNFNYPSGLDLRANMSPVYARGHWSECRSQRTAASIPGSGC